MKRVFVNEQWCLGCHLCEYNCAFAAVANSEPNMTRALKNSVIDPVIRVEEDGDVCFAIGCRHCSVPLCVKGCLTGALSVTDGVISVDKNRCVHCYTCVLSCPYGAVMPSADGAVRKCELCLQTTQGTPRCVAGCPNGAIVFEERE
ncbi:4Fe-4S ferredoxin [Clostridia bacterium]|nr:4Fe-4S ferredoxin [Clostridia bacterium]